MLELLLVGTLAAAVLVLIACAIGDASEQRRPFESRTLHSACGVNLEREVTWQCTLDAEPLEEEKKAA